MAVQHDADGSYVVTSGDSTDVYKTLREALDAALPTVATHEKAARLRDVDSGELNGAWRWLPATDVEPAAKDGVRIDAQAIREMADSLNTSPRPVPIDGGPTPEGMLPSPVHGTAYHSGTPANGWAHWGVVVEGPGPEDAKLYLYSELMPPVAREVDAGRNAEGSVHFGFSSQDGELPRGVELISHALTNDPAVKTLAPANSVRGLRLGSRLVSTVGALRARPPGVPMKNQAKRSTLADAEQMIQSLLPDVKPEDLGTEVLKLVASHCESVNKPEMGDAGEGEMASDAPADDAARTAPVAPDAAAAGACAPGDETKRGPVAGLPDEAAKDKFIADALAALVNAGIAQDANDAGAALAALQAFKPAGGTDGDPSQQMSDQRSRSGEYETLRADNEKLRKRVATLEAAERATANDKWLSAQADKFKLVVRGDDRVELLKLVADLGDDRGRSTVESILRARNVPPTGVVMKDNADDHGVPGQPASVTAAIDACLEEAAKEAPKGGEPKAHTRSRATKLAKDKWPALFGGASIDDI